MGMSPDTHLFYGYVWDAETNLHSILRTDEDDEISGDDWKDVLLVRRGFVNPWKTYPDKATAIEMARNASDEVYNKALARGHVYGAKADRKFNDDRVNERIGGNIYGESPEFKAIYDVWKEAQKALKEEFSCDLSSYGSDGVQTAYLYVASEGRWKRSWTSSWDGPTQIDSTAIAALNTDQMNVWLQEFIEALDLPMDKPEYGEAPVGPGWFMVTSYG